MGEKLTPRERVLRAVNLEEPDRVPIDLGGTHITSITTPAYEKLKAHLGIKSETAFLSRRSHIVIPDEEVLRRFNVDTRIVLPEALEEAGREISPDGTYVDEWGVERKMPEGGHYYVSKVPFAGDCTVSDIEKHHWPDPTDPRRYADVGEKARVMHEKSDYAITMMFPGRVISFGQFLRGFDVWMMDLIADQKFAGALMDKGLEIQLEMGKRLLETVGDNVDIAYVADDLGMQCGPLISRDIYTKMIKPRQKRVFEFIRSHTRAKLFYHSCGSVYAFIPDFIEMGVEILNPVQVSAKDMDSQKLKREFGDKICFWGGVDTHRVLPFGTTEEVREEVKRRIADLAPGGGYVFNAVHNIQADVPPENVCAMFEAAAELGNYR